ncbi:HAMP domain-containing sensor histidine kinase [Flavivirga amylovorans]|uniref:histidine kinase n=1 Tax=Flavivirga amylovorans TaxID=870486 RepID=A0ABT8WYL7_9FLAO|nr:HAMP domain-containing sensor histidine kinase [Flavivirga amylovorans]MDO5986777.1 HAMP domain-containing sensor histidine kinase [Flavivirga amylovorans]
MLLLLVLIGITLTIGGILYIKKLKKNANTINKLLEEEKLKTDSLNTDLKFLKEVLIPVVSHDYRSPLVTIKSSLLRMQLDENYHAKDFENNLKTLNNQIDNTLSLLDDMLLYTKNRLTDANSDLQDISIAWLINKNIDLMQHIIFEKQLQVIVNVSEVLQEKQTVAVSVVDITIRNLLSNATKVAPVSSTIQIRSFIQDKNLVILVKDEGKGLTEYEAAHLFNQSSQKTPLLHLESFRLKSSLGFGLQLVKELLVSCQGQIWVEPSHKDSKGATFGFMVPLH